MYSPESEQKKAGCPTVFQVVLLGELKYSLALLSCERAGSEIDRCAFFTLKMPYFTRGAPLLPPCFSVLIYIFPLIVPYMYFLCLAFKSCLLNKLRFF
jgi:hypothetical protein